MKLLDLLKGFFGPKPVVPVAPADPNAPPVPVVVQPDRWVAWGRWGVSFLGWLAGVLTFILFITGKSPVPAPAPGLPPALPSLTVVAVANDEPPADLAYGWVDDPEAVKAAKATIKTVFRNTPAGSDGELPDAVYQWKLYEKVTGKKFVAKNQNPVGSCVGFGSTLAYERALSCAIASGMPYDFTEFTDEVTYAFARVEIGGGRLRGDDGAVGAWAAQGIGNKGMLPRGKYGRWDFTKYSPSLCRQLGDNGVPDELEPEAKGYIAGDVAPVSTWMDVKKALARGAGVFVCSRIGFNKQRDANGVATPGPRWGHCMCVDGYHIDKATGREYAHFQNSWAQIYHTGPVGWGEPDGGGFWADSRVTQQMLNERDSFAVAAVKGFPKLDIDWFILHTEWANANPVPTVGKCFSLGEKEATKLSAICSSMSVTWPSQRRREGAELALAP